MLIIEKDFHRTNLKRLVHTLCLVIPILMAIAGFFLADPIWSLFSKNKATELFKFLCSIAFFIIPTIIIFILSRKENPVMKIRIFNDKN